MVNGYNTYNEYNDICVYIYIYIKGKKCQESPDFLHIFTFTFTYSQHFKKNVLKTFAALLNKHKNYM